MARVERIIGLRTLLFSVVVGMAALTPLAEASWIYYYTPAGATIDGQPVNARVTFTTSSDHVSMLLENLQVDPKSVGQNVSSLMFTIGSGETSGVLLDSAAIPRTVYGKRKHGEGEYSEGEYVDGIEGNTGWNLRTTGEQLELYVLGVHGVGPAHTLIGPPGASGMYDSANGSIAGNRPHNVFLGGWARFELSVPGVTQDSVITAVTFGFGTSGHDFVTGLVIPEPTTLCLLAMASIPVLWRSGRKRR